MAELPAPKAPHDDYSLDELARAYNFENTSSMHDVMARALVKEIGAHRQQAGLETVRALNVGCGEGIGRQRALLEPVDAAIDEHWAVEPDTAVKPDPMYQNFQHALMEAADLPDAYFDIIYSAMVVEHVADPDAFMAAIARCLKPGGIHVFMTVNGAHYFGRLAWLMQRLRIDEAVLRLARHEESVDAYHYPVQYRMNTASKLRSLAQRHGFEEPTLAFIENKGPAPYFPKPVRFVYHGLRLKRRMLRRPEALLTLLCRMRRQKSAPRERDRARPCDSPRVNGDDRRPSLVKEG